MRLLHDIQVRGSGEHSRSVIEAFRSFLRSTQAERETSSRVRDARLGYLHGYQEERRQRSYDSTKDFFHYTAGYEALVDLESNPSLARLVRSMAELDQAIRPDILECIRNVSQVAGVGRQFFLDERDSIRSYALRVVRYHELAIGAYHIPPHYDQGSLTICLFQSAPGLRIVEPAAPTKVDLDGDRACALGGMNLELESSSQVSSTWHDVVQTVGGERFATMIFIDAEKPRHFLPEVRYRSRELGGGLTSALPPDSWSW